MMPQDLENLVDKTFRRFDAEWLLARLRDHHDDVYLVGGAIRDYLRDPQQTPNDLDLMTSGNPDLIADLFRPLGLPRVNRHGNLRFSLENGRHIDLIHTRRFYGRAHDVPRALHFFDASINAVAVRLKEPILLDPLAGTRHIIEGRVVLPSARWRSSDPFEDVHVLLRLIRLIERTGSRVENPDLALRHTRWFDDVNWADLERLNGFGRAETERRLAFTFSSHEPKAQRRLAAHASA